MEQQRELQQQMRTDIANCQSMPPDPQEMCMSNLKAKYGGALSPAQANGPDDVSPPLGFGKDWWLPTTPEVVP